MLWVVVGWCKRIFKLKEKTKNFSVQSKKYFHLSQQSSHFISSFFFVFVFVDYMLSIYKVKEKVNF